MMAISARVVVSIANCVKTAWTTIRITHRIETANTKHLNLLEDRTDSTSLSSPIMNDLRNDHKRLVCPQKTRMIAIHAQKLLKRIRVKMIGIISGMGGGIESEVLFYEVITRPLIKGIRKEFDQLQQEKLKITLIVKEYANIKP